MTGIFVDLHRVKKTGSRPDSLPSKEALQMSLETTRKEFGTLP